MQVLESFNAYVQAGWGDLRLVDFERDAELLRHWPPKDFDIQVRQLRDSCFSLATFRAGEAEGVRCADPMEESE